MNVGSMLTMEVMLVNFSRICRWARVVDTLMWQGRQQVGAVTMKCNGVGEEGNSEKYIYRW
jgi:hypothetical protein